MKLKHLFLILLLITALLSGCQFNNNDDSQAPTIKVTANGQEINCIGMISDDSPNEADLSIFTELITSKNELCFVNLGENIELSCEFATELSEITLYDRILTDAGLNKYDNELTQELKVELDKNKGSFSLNSSSAAFLSSDSRDFESGETLRGFSFSLEHDGKDYLYCFAVHTDAA